MTYQRDHFVRLDWISFFGTMVLIHFPPPHDQVFDQISILSEGVSNWRVSEASEVQKLGTVHRKTIMG